MFVNNRLTTEIWDMMDKRRVWRRAYAYPQQFAVAQEIEDNRLVLATPLRDRLILEILRIDNWTLAEAMTIMFPFGRRTFWVQEVIVGELVAIFRTKILLINWRAQRFVLSDGFGDSHLRLGLIPGHILILNAYSSKPDEMIPAPRLFVYATASFDFGSHWRPLNELNDELSTPPSFI
ncbi:hypothetical protein B0H19DRAFT_1078932 [Mycena capillaripes]|nr:hypothetical protein B0H19DRAFT_1078932 [Mycena capillaripes]